MQCQGTETNNPHNNQPTYLHVCLILKSKVQSIQNVSMSRIDAQSGFYVVEEEIF